MFGPERDISTCSYLPSALHSPIQGYSGGAITKIPRRLVHARTSHCHDIPWLQKLAITNYYALLHPEVWIPVGSDIILTDAYYEQYHQFG
jgi:hypothetical protein